MLEILSLLLFVIVVILIAYLFYLMRERSVLIREIDLRAEQKFTEMKDRFKGEVLERSRAVLKGRIAEQIVPFLEEFQYNPSDARFIGSPIDYIVFDGYTDVKDRKEDRPITIVLADIKMGERAELTYEQKRIKEALEQKRVKWETIYIRKAFSEE